MGMILQNHPRFCIRSSSFPDPVGSNCGRVSEDILKNRNSHPAHGVPGKNDDFGGVFNPLAGKLFSVTKSISRNGKHSLLSPETYNVPGTQKRVEYHVPFPLVRRPI